ncbi:hypothetical protein [Planococcus halotolerans]|uniref:GGDEF domain-containing protein n=1 Tax=Planococcus halotolerans TaxID=2233542 RepID=A0A365KP90_9BACL|nr:hypothetical protein [Planococcus halotolerans]QHJ71812.1 hypothetical protein DNR44_014840 [Planococcus halotolerans]RAZ74572.1 hypothetical protein DP120_14680 [Planococcus halotolerans]
MNKFKLVPLYMIPALMAGAALFYLPWPFATQALIVAIASVPILLFLTSRKIPIFMFGALLVLMVFALQELDNLLETFVTYFLFLIFQLSIWSIADYIQQLLEDMNRLKVQRQELLQSDGEIKVLSLQEFIEQAFWLLRMSSRKERIWLMEVVPAINSLAERGRMEQAVLGSIAKERDLVTSKHGTVYLLVKETEQESIHSLLKHLDKAIDQKNQSAGYEIKKTIITKVCEMDSLLS